MLNSQNQMAQLQSILQDTQAEIAQADNTLRQIEHQIKRKAGPEQGEKLLNAKRPSTQNAGANQQG